MEYSQRLARSLLLAIAALAAGALGCSSDDNHGPTVGSPTGPAPIVVSEGGGTPGNAGTSAGANGGENGIDSGGALSSGGIGTSAGTSGDPFATAGSGTFGTAGSGFSVGGSF